MKIKLNNVASTLALLNNPVRNTATLQYQSTVAEKVIVRLYDASGKITLTKSFDAVPGLNQFKFDASTLSSGVYITELKTRNGTFTLRLLKQ